MRFFKPWKSHPKSFICQKKTSSGAPLFLFLFPNASAQSSPFPHFSCVKVIGRFLFERLIVRVTARETRASVRLNDRWLGCQNAHWSPKWFFDWRSAESIIFHFALQREKTSLFLRASWINSSVNRPYKREISRDVYYGTLRTNL